VILIAVHRIVRFKYLVRRRSRRQNDEVDGVSYGIVKFNRLKSS